MRHGIAVASACDACVHLIGDAEEFGPDRHMGIVCDDCVPELQAAGWVLTTYWHEPPDIVCVHYHEAHRRQ